MAENVETPKPKRQMTPEVANLHNKIKNDIVNAADGLAASVIQTIAGVPAENRIEAPNFGFGGLRIAMRLVSRPAKKAGTVTIQNIADDLFANNPSLNAIQQLELIFKAAAARENNTAYQGFSKKQFQALTTQAIDIIENMTPQEILNLEKKLIDDVGFASDMLAMENVAGIKKIIKNRLGAKGSSATQKAKRSQLLGDPKNPATIGTVPELYENKLYKRVLQELLKYSK